MTVCGRFLFSPAIQTAYAHNASGREETTCLSGTLSVVTKRVDLLDWYCKANFMKYFVYCRKSTEDEGRQVLSIESQESEATRVLQAFADIEVVEVLKEAYSAQRPGRPVFDRMLDRIEGGEAEGIIAWHPDRLARNSLDAGRIIHLLDQQILKDLKFSTFTFENNSQGKFMLAIMLGYSKYYVDNLSENVKRGNRAKLERGWRPGTAPLGYVNDKDTKTIVKDPVHFALVKRIYELMLSGSYAPRQIALMSRDEWGFRTPKRKRIGGKPLAMSTIYKMLSNPFYAGVLVWKEQTYPGKHEPVVTIDEFERVQELLGRPGRPRQKRHQFPFTGMIRCGSCGLMVTAEHKVNRFGSRYVYYHCTNRRIGPRCSEPVVQQLELNRQICAFLEEVQIPESIFSVVKRKVSDLKASHTETAHTRQQSIEQALKGISKELSELTGLRLRNLLSDEDFVTKRRELKQNEIRLQRQLDDPENELFEPISDLLLLRNMAVDWFLNGSPQDKKQILYVTGSNLSLKGKKLNIEARKPFRRLGGNADFFTGLALIDDVRTWIKENPVDARTFSNIIKALAAKAALREKKAA